MAPADPTELLARCAALEAENARLARVNEALMDRVERDTDLQGGSFSLFQAASALEAKVNERTGALQRALVDLERSNAGLQASNEAAQQASRAKSAFLATMSHELRTPMNGVVGMTEILLNTPLNEQQRRSAEQIRRSALSLLAILNDILDYSKIDAGHMKTESVPFDLKRTTEQALQLLMPEIRAKGLRFTLDWEPELASGVIGDPTRYAQVITNLVGNAVKFTAEGGVTLRARQLGSQGSRLTLQFEVIDTGIGIRPEVIPKLFESFTQSDSSITRQFGGTGLGLAIVRRLCRLMGGDCGVTSEYGKGSRFWFRIDLKRNASALAPQGTVRLRILAPPVDSGATRRQRVLLVEDNLVNQEVAAGLLELLGCDCTVADNGRIAVEKLTAPHEFDLVLMDCQMPEMDGFEATHRVRAYETEFGLHTPIIALTANAMTGDRELCLASGMDDFMSKPFQMRELQAVVDKWCPHPSARLRGLTSQESA